MGLLHMPVPPKFVASSIFAAISTKNIVRLTCLLHDFAAPRRRRFESHLRTAGYPVVLLGSSGESEKVTFLVWLPHNATICLDIEQVT